MPKSPYGIGAAKVNDPTTWSDYYTAKTASEQMGYSGVGIILTGGICGIDIDAKKDDANKCAKEILDHFSDTYVEFSPSGAGYHILCLCDDNRLPILKDANGNPLVNKNGKYMLDGYNQRNDSLELEIYPSSITNRYFTFTENTVNGNDLIDKTEDVIWFFNRYMNETQEDNYTVSRVDDVIAKAKTACNGRKFCALFYEGDISMYCGDDSRADLALCSMLAYWCNGDKNLINECFEKSALVRDKWRNRADYRDRTIDKAISNQIKPLTAYTNEEGKRVPLTIDALEAWLDSTGIVLKYNEITHSIMIDGLDCDVPQDEIAETFPTIIYDKIKSQFKTNQAEVTSYLKVIYLKNGFNPILVYLSEQKPWDGYDRVSELYCIMRLDEDDSLSRTLVHKWLKMAYAMLFNNSRCSFGSDGILVLQGKQGIGKSMLCSRLGINQELSKTGLDIDTRDKDTIIRATSCFIGELGEIGSTFKSDLDRLKAFITESVDRYRIPYGRTDVNVVRHASYIATTNDERFLLDPTGSRRFWTVACNHPFDLDKLNNLDIGQLWKQIEAEMSAFEYSNAYNSDFQTAFRLSTEERAQLEERNGVLMKYTKGEQEVKDVLASAKENPIFYTDRVTTVTVWKNSHSALSRFSSEEIGKVLKKLGYEAKSSRIDGVPHSSCYKLPFRTEEDCPF